MDPVSGMFYLGANFPTSRVVINLTSKLQIPENCQSTQSVEITVENVNRAPVLNPVEDGSVYENSVIAFSLSGTG